MKSLIKTLSLCILLAGCGTIPEPVKMVEMPQPETVKPERQEGQAFFSFLQMVCNESKLIYNNLKSEPDPRKPMLWGLKKDDQGVAKAMIQIWVGNTGNFSIVESTTNGFSCIVTGGSELDVLPHPHPEWSPGKFAK